MTITEIVSNPSLIPGNGGGGASAFFRNPAAVAGVFTAVGLLIATIIALLIWRARSRRRRNQLEHETAVAAIMDGRRSTGRLTLIDDDDEDGDDEPMSSTERSASELRRLSSRESRSQSDSHSSSHGRMSPIDSAGQMTFRTPFPPVSLLAASYNRRRSSSSHGHGGSGGRYQHLRTESVGPSRFDLGRNPSPPPQYSLDQYRDPFSDSPSVSYLLGAGGDNRFPPPPAIMDEFEPAPGTLPVPLSPNRAQRDLFTQKRGFGYDNPFSSTTSLGTGASTPRDLEVRNVFDEELGSVPKIGRRPVLGVHTYPS